MLDHSSGADDDAAARASTLLTRFWVAKGNYVEAQRRIRALLTRDLSAAARGQLLTSLAEIEDWLGHIDAAEAAAQEALLLAESSGQAQVLADALRNLAWVAFWRDEHEEAAATEERAVVVATAVDERRRLVALHDLGIFQNDAGLREEARSTLRSAAEGARAVGDLELETDAVANLAELDLYARDFASAYDGLRAVLASKRTINPHSINALVFVSLGWAALGLERWQEARVAFWEALESFIDTELTSRYEFTRAITGVALAAEPERSRFAARLQGQTLECATLVNSRFRPRTVNSLASSSDRSSTSSAKRRGQRSRRPAGR